MTTSWMVKHVVIINKELSGYTFLELRRRNTAKRLAQSTQQDALYKDCPLQYFNEAATTSFPILSNLSFIKYSLDTDTVRILTLTS
jgi:hypothetical protein